MSDGWFVVNIRDAAWEDHDVFGACCTFESPNSKFAELGFRLCVLQPAAGYPDDRVERPGSWSELPWA